MRSYPGEEGPVQRAVAAGWRSRACSPSCSRPARRTGPNVIARVENGPGPTMLLNGHTDTVLAVGGVERAIPGTAEREGDRLYGLGAAT